MAPPSPPRRARLARAVAASFERAALPVAAVALVVALGFGIIVPVLPLYARSFDVGATQVGLLVSVFALVRLATDVPAGRVVTRLGPARAVALGTAIVGVSSAAAGLAATFAQLVVLRGLGGIGSALFSTGLMTYLLAVVPRDRLGRAISAYNGPFLLGMSIGPTVGGAAAEALGLRGPFFVYAAFCAVATAVALAVLRPPRAPRPAAGAATTASPAPSRPARRGPSALRPNWSLAAALAGGFALWWLLGGYRFAFIPLYGEARLGLDHQAIGVGLTVSALANLLLLWPAGWATDRVGRHATGILAFLGLTATVAIMLSAADYGGYLLVNATLGVGYAAASVVPGALLADAAPRERAGEASGLSYLASDLGSVLGPLAIGAALDAAGYPAATALTALPLLVAAATIALAARPAASRGRGR